MEPLSRRPLWITTCRMNTGLIVYLTAMSERPVWHRNMDWNLTESRQSTVWAGGRKSYCDETLGYLSDSTRTNFTTGKNASIPDHEEFNHFKCPKQFAPHILCSSSVFIVCNQTVCLILEASCLLLFPNLSFLFCTSFLPNHHTHTFILKKT